MIKPYGTWRSRLWPKKQKPGRSFLEARKAGFVYCQEYFFRRPEVMTAREIPANRINYPRMLQAVSKPELDPKEIEGVIKSEAICYRLLRFSHRDSFRTACPLYSR